MKKVTREMILGEMLDSIYRYIKHVSEFIYDKDGMTELYDFENDLVKLVRERSNKYPELKGGS